MLVKAGHVCLFVDGWGVELPEERIRGTELKSGDDVSRETIDKLRAMNPPTQPQQEGGGS